jgi:hypothetical protein
LLVTPFCHQKEKRKKMNERMKYESPLAQVRGIFLEDGLAAPVSVLGGTITQDAWVNSDTPVGDGTSRDGDVFVDL